MKKSANRASRAVGL